MNRRPIGELTYVGVREARYRPVQFAVVFILTAPLAYGLLAIASIWIPALDGRSSIELSIGVGLVAGIVRYHRAKNAPLE